MKNNENYESHVLNKMLFDESTRDLLFSDPKITKSIIENINDINFLRLEFLLKKAEQLFDVDKLCGLKLMFHIYMMSMKTTNHHITNAIELYLSNEMTNELCSYIRSVIDNKYLCKDLSDSDSTWLAKNIVAWGCRK